MGNRLLIYTLLLLLLVSCRPACQYPDDKFWAHGATGVGLGRNAEELFGGRMEVDINYSDYRDSLFLGHDLCDTAKGLTLDAWLDSLRHPAVKVVLVDYPEPPNS